MNGGPYRAPQPSDRRVINGSGSVPPRQPEEPQESPKAEPSVTRRAPSDSKPTSNKPSVVKRLISWLVVLLLVAVVAFGAWFVWTNVINKTDAGIDSSKYQAVFLTNGQIYFGKLHTYDGEYLRLTTGYYPQAKATDEATTDTTETDTSASGIQLIRLGDEVYGPEDEIFISKKQILHYENLKSDSKVSQLIDQNEQSK